MYSRMLVAIDASPDSPDDSLNRTIQFAKMTGATVYLLHVARGHIIPTDISAGSGFGVRSPEDDADVRERQVVQDAVDTIAAAGIEVHGEMIEATEHDVAYVILQRAKELDVDIIVLGYQHHRGSVVADHVIRQQPQCSVLLARPPQTLRQERPRTSRMARSR
jgi:nucleotide-binding universal stress UspA family protein